MLQPSTTLKHMQYGSLELNPARRSVIAGGKSVRLTPTEYRLLAVLIAADGRVVSADQLLYRVWGQGYDGFENYLWVHLSRLRRKLETIGTASLIVNERGAGYRVCKHDAARGR